MIGKLLIGALIIACIAPLFIKDGNGRPIMTIKDWKISFPAWVDDAAYELKDVASGGEMGAGDTVYKWQDEDGQWHFGSEAPEGIPAEQMTIDGAATVIPGGVAIDQNSRDEDSAGAALPALGTSVSPEEIREMFETVDTVKETFAEREAQLKDIAD